MGKVLFPLMVVLTVFLCCGSTGYCRSPFMSKENRGKVLEPSAKTSTLLLKMSRFQQQIRQKMAGLVREAKTDKRLEPLVLVILIAFGYGALHAAGPGHGKAVATSYMLSQKVTLGGGLAFGVLTALVHGFSGILCVVALHYVLKQSVSSGLGTVSTITQGISFSLIGVLGLGVLIHNAYSLFKGPESSEAEESHQKTASRKSFLPWAAAVGLVPCPGVVMVLLFCMSMDAFILGLVLAVAISMGMALTISIVILAVVFGKGFSMRFFSNRGAFFLEHGLGVFSGLAITVMAGLILLSMKWT